MRLSWSQHLNAARIIELSADDQAAQAMALMGVALLMLMQDLASEADRGAHPPVP